MTAGRRVTCKEDNREIPKMKTLFRLFALSLVMVLGVGSYASAEELLVYTALEDDEIPGYLEIFKKAHPDVDVKIVRDSTGIITAKILAEKDNPQADVIWGTAATSLMLADQACIIEPYAPKGLDRVRPKMRDAANPPHWVGIKAWMTGFCVNTIETKAVNLPTPKSYADLIKPVYKDALIMPNPASSGTGFLTVSAILQQMGREKRLGIP